MQSGKSFIAAHIGVKFNRPGGPCGWGQEWILSLLAAYKTLFSVLPGLGSGDS